MKRLLMLALLLAAAHVVAAPLQDGPYLTRSSDGAWVARWIGGEDSAPRVRETAVAVGGEVTVPAVGSLPAFKVKLRPLPASRVADEVKLPTGVPFFVMADTHGEYAIAVELLQKQKVIDSKLRWSFGKGRLAVLGDIFDRGPNHTEIFWLLYALEAQAKAAGGALYVTLGNHESLELGGQERDLNPKYVAVRRALNAPTYASLWGPDSLLGQWLRTKPAVMKIGDFLCLHGGLSAGVVQRGLSLVQLNDSVRSSLGERDPGGFALSPEGPLWYRGYFPEIARQAGMTVATSADVDSVLRFYGAKAILVGHTRVETVTSLFDGRVIAVQVYPRPGDMQGLLVKGGLFYRARIDGTTEILGSPQSPGG
jgi:calcineurin-like phosphoesterase family protein